MRRGVALGAASVALFLSLWVWLPAPVSPFLALSVGAPELSIWLFIGAALTLGFAWRYKRRRVGRIAVGLAAAAMLLPGTVLLRIPFTLASFDRAMSAGLGENYLDTVPARARARLREHAVSIGGLFFGLPEVGGQIEHGISFLTSDGLPLAIEIYRPDEPGPWPTVVQIYGGGWQNGSATDDAEAGRAIASAGYVVFAIDYRHAPTWRWPIQRDDVVSAIRWVYEHAIEYGGDASRLALVGRSSGAQLAMTAAALPDVPPVAAIVSYYGPADLVDGYAHPPIPDPIGVRVLMRDLFGGAPDQLSDAYREASPMTHASQPHPPVLMIAAGRDAAVRSRHTATLDAKLRQTGTSVLLTIPWADHAFDAVPFGPSAQIAAYYTERFLAWALAR